ncbi:MAG: hypothetical protein L0215_07980 [Gemmataceae bacterium]|nr:hypothetical protein [Gemmataceae bacterium]
MLFKRGWLIGLVFVLGVAVGATWPASWAQRRDDIARTPSVHDRVRTQELSPNSYESKVDFPNSEHPKRTSWRIRYTLGRTPAKNGTVENLVLHQAYFRPNPQAEELQILEQAHMAETLVAYSKGTRFYDVADHGQGLLKTEAGDLGAHGAHLSKDGKIVGELRDRGILWKYGHGEHHALRGEAFLLWSVFKAGNYLYIIQFGFQDDGVITFRMGSTGSNFTADRTHSHMHNALWRLDVDLGGSTPNSVYLVKHREPMGMPGHGKEEVELFNGGLEGFADWNDREFTSLRIANHTKTNSLGHFQCYDLVALRQGSARHFGPEKGSKTPDEEFTRHDFWVLPFASKDKKTEELDCTKLPAYVRQGRKIENSDVVIWYNSAAHHIPRDEDFAGPKDARRPGATTVVWSGFDLRPRDVFDATPFFTLPEKKKK